MTDYLYRVVVTKMPEGSHWEQELDDGTLIGGPVEGWAPAGWKPEGNYVEMLGTTDFVWPVTNRLYKSRSTANKRAALMRRYGAECQVQRSSRITWPDEEQVAVKRVDGGVEVPFILLLDALKEITDVVVGAARRNGMGIPVHEGGERA